MIFNTRQLHHFLGHTEIFKGPHQADIGMFANHISLTVSPQRVSADHKLLQLRIWDELLPWAAGVRSLRDFHSSISQPCVPSPPSNASSSTGIDKISENGRAP